MSVIMSSLHNLLTAVLQVTSMCMCAYSWVAMSTRSALMPPEGAELRPMNDIFGEVIE